MTREFEASVDAAMDTYDERLKVAHDARLAFLKQQNDPRYKDVLFSTQKLERARTVASLVPIDEFLKFLNDRLYDSKGTVMSRVEWDHGENNNRMNEGSSCLLLTELTLDDKHLWSTIVKPSKDLGSSLMFCHIAHGPKPEVLMEIVFNLVDDKTLPRMTSNAIIEDNCESEFIDRDNAWLMWAESEPEVREAIANLAGIVVKKIENK